MSMAINGKKKTFKSLDDVLGFGLYANRTVKDVLLHDISYLEWMHNKTNNKLGKRLINEIEALDEKYINLFK